MSESFEDDDVLRARLEECLLANNAKEMKILKLRAALKPFANAAEKARKEKGDPAYGLRWDDFLRAQNCFTNDEQALADREQE